MGDIRLYDFDVPPEQVAQQPVEPRDAARLLVLDRAIGVQAHARVSELPGFLAPGDCLVVNDARVIPARLRGRRPSGGAVELLLVRPLGSALPGGLPASAGVSNDLGRGCRDQDEAPPGDSRSSGARPGWIAPGSLRLPGGPGQRPSNEVGKELWEALARPARAIEPGQRLLFAPPLAGEVVAAAGDGVVVVAFEGGPVLAELERQGEVPLPPYIRRRPGEASARGPDRVHYQTVYAARDGAVAAPTAGLHFTPRLLAALQAHGVRIVRLTLWVGPGTFVPIRGDDYTAHRMAAERYEVTEAAAAAINEARADGGRVIAVGTTVTRTLETVTDDSGRVGPGSGETSLYITPGYRFRAIDGLMTNFHQPCSTPLLLAAAFAGRERLLSAYSEAIHLGYRLFSYGDAMLIL